jgi:pyruvate dehydrogenase E1 component
VNKVGVWSARERVDWFADDPETILHWREQPGGQIWSSGSRRRTSWGCSANSVRRGRGGVSRCCRSVSSTTRSWRALEPWSFGVYAGGQSILVGTPSGVTLAPEGGAHQSITTPSVGLEQPGCLTDEPAAHR